MSKTTIIADFSTTLTAKWAIGATTGTITSATDGDGVALPTGRYGFTIDRNNAAKEYIVCTLTGTSLTDIKHVSRQGVETSGTTKEHRKGAEIAITDFVAINEFAAVAGDNTWTGDNTWEGEMNFTNIGDVNVNGKSNPAPVVADTTARDALYTAPVTGDVVYVTALNAMQIYNGNTAQWETLDVGTPAPVATTSIQGLVKIHAASADPKAIVSEEAGTSGTAVSASNKLVDAADTTGTGLLVRASLSDTQIQTYTSNDTWTKPAGAKIVEVYAIGGGGGGGGGGGAFNSSPPGGSGGGGGGGGGGYAKKTINASALGSTESVVVGAGGAGGAGGTSNPGTVGTAGTVGGASSFGTTTIVRAAGGAAGAAGTSGVSGGGTGGVGGSANGDAKAAGGAGGAGGGGGNSTGTIGTAGTSTDSDLSPRGGGGGAGGSGNTTAANGGVGGGFITNYVKTGGTGGVGVNSGSGGAGTVGQNIASTLLIGGTGGGGGAGGASSGVGLGLGGNGANGGTYGAGGGGGGGAATNGNPGITGGTGGAGAAGVVVVVTYF